ncbi:MAG: COP23 domain-containing protein [Cyanobacteria bacterium P01_D01_bin.105]
MTQNRRLYFSASLSLLLGTVLLAGSTALPGNAQSSDPLPDVDPQAEGNAPISDDVRFECQLSNGQYTVMYLPESQPSQAYPWATPTTMGGGWTAENRCFTIADRLESYRPEGLAELQVGTENGYDIVCATTEQIPGLCKIVFTVPPGQDPTLTRDLVFENLTLADSGTDTTIVNTYTGDGSNNILGDIGSGSIGLGQIGQILGEISNTGSRRASGINLKPFLDSSDGGTGAALTRTSAAPARILNPDNFR